MVAAAGRSLVVLAALLLAAPPVVGQQEQAVAGDTAPPAPRAIPPDSAPEQAFTTQAWLSVATDRLPADSTLARLETALGPIRAAYNRLLLRSAPERLESMYLDDLADLAGRWAQTQRRLGTWRSETGALTERVQATHDSLTTSAERWRLTRQESWNDLPAPVQRQVTTVRRATDSVLRATRVVLDRVLTLEARGAELEVDVAAQIEGVRAAEGRARRALLRQDSPALWRLLRSVDRDSVSDTTAAESADRFEAAADYLYRHTGRVRLHFLLFLAAVMALWFVSRRRGAWATAELAIHWPSELLAHPGAAGWLLALALTRSIYPDAPRSVYGLAFLLLVPALVILLRVLLSPRLRIPAYALLGLYAFRVLADTFDWSPVAARFVLFGLAVAGVAVLTWFGRLLAADDAGASRPRWRGVGRTLAFAGGALLGVAALANLFGFATLAALLLVATLASGLMALALAALVDVVVGVLLVVLLATPVGRLQVIHQNRALMTRRVAAVVAVAGLALWLSLALRQFRLSGPAWEAISAVLTTPLTVGSWSFTAGDVLLFGVTLWLAFHLARGLRAVLREDVLGRMTLDRGVSDSAASIAYYLALAVGMVFAVGAAGIDFSRLALVAGALGVGIGFGLQSIVANFISGLVLLFERPIKSGDTVELEGLKGVVERIGIRASTIRTFQGSEVIVPNQDLIVERVINWTLSDPTRRVEIPIGVAYGSDPSQAMTIMREAAGGRPGVLAQPPAAVLFTGYGESSLDFELRVWARTDEWIEVRSDVLVAVYEAFAAHGIEIPFPQRDLHVRSVDPQAGEALRPSSSG